VRVDDDTCHPAQEGKNCRGTSYFFVVWIKYQICSLPDNPRELEELDITELTRRSVQSQAKKLIFPLDDCLLS
jgi:hypothetical protein